MSLEDSIKTFAEAANNLASAMNNYAGVMQAISKADPDKIITANVTAPAVADKPAGKPGRKPKEEPAASKKEDDGLGGDEDDGLGGEEEAAKDYTADDVKAALVALKGKNPEALKKVWNKFGVTSLGQLDKSKYGEVMKYVGSL